MSMKKISFKGIFFKIRQDLPDCPSNRIEGSGDDAVSYSLIHFIEMAPVEQLIEI
jgi:hypothetical protein